MHVIILHLRSPSLHRRQPVLELAIGPNLCLLLRNRCIQKVSHRLTCARACGCSSGPALPPARHWLTTLKSCCCSKQRARGAAAVHEVTHSLTHSLTHDITPKHRSHYATITNRVTRHDTTMIVFLRVHIDNSRATLIPPPPLVRVLTHDARAPLADSSVPARAHARLHDPPNAPRIQRARGDPPAAAVTHLTARSEARSI